MGGELARFRDPCSSDAIHTKCCACNDNEWSIGMDTIFPIPDEQVRVDEMARPSSERQGAGVGFFGQAVVGQILQESVPALVSSLGDDAEDEVEEDSETAFMKQLDDEPAFREVEDTDLATERVLWSENFSSASSPRNSDEELPSWPPEEQLAIEPESYKSHAPHGKVSLESSSGQALDDGVIAKCRSANDDDVVHPRCEERLKDASERTQNAAKQLAPECDDMDRIALSRKV